MVARDESRELDDPDDDRGEPPERSEATPSEGDPADPPRPESPRRPSPPPCDDPGAELRDRQMQGLRLRARLESARAGAARNGAPDESGTA